jgi:hypothetical protein
LQHKQFHTGYKNAVLVIRGANASVELAGRARRIAREILAYLAKHPEAKDTPGGIRQWWLDEPDCFSDKEVRMVAEELVERGLLRVWEAGPGSTIFGPTAAFLRTPETFLREFHSGRVKREH